MARAAQRLQNHKFDLLQIVIRTRSHHARGAVARGSEGGKPAIAPQAFLCCELPVGREYFNQLRNHRSLELEMSVEHRMPRMSVRQVLRADVESTGEDGPSVDTEYLLVTAQVEEWHSPGQRGMQKARGGNTGAMQ